MTFFSASLSLFCTHYLLSLSFLIIFSGIPKTEITKLKNNTIERNLHVFLCLRDISVVKARNYSWAAWKFYEFWKKKYKRVIYQLQIRVCHKHAPGDKKLNSPF